MTLAEQRFPLRCVAAWKDFNRLDARCGAEAEVQCRIVAREITRGWLQHRPMLRSVQSLRVDRSRLADQANALLQQQRTSEAEAVLTRLLDSFPDDVEGLLLFGRLRYQQSRCPEAETAWRKHLTVQPNSLNGFDSTWHRSDVSAPMDECRRDFRTAIALKPDFAQAHNNLGLARSRAGDSVGAMRAFRDALRCDPGDLNAHVSLAEELANAGELGEVREHIERAAALNPNDPRIRVAREQLGVK